MENNGKQCILDRIVASKREEIARSRELTPPAEIRRRAERAGPVRDFVAAFGAKPPAGIHLLAEIKHASPSAGEIRPVGDFPGIARAFEKSGAAAISVLTDSKFFRGSLDQMIAVRSSVALPVLRKEFIIDDYQVFESRAAGADAILLMTQILDDARLASLLQLTRELGMSALVEGHSESEIRRAVACGARVIGINNRDLRTFETDLETTPCLIGMVPPERIVISQSAIKTRADVVKLQACGARAVQVGETLMRSGNVAAKIAELLGR